MLSTRAKIQSNKKIEHKGIKRITKNNTRKNDSQILLCRCFPIIGLGLVLSGIGQRTSIGTRRDTQKMFSLLTKHWLLGKKAPVYKVKFKENNQGFFTCFSL